MATLLATMTAFPNQGLMCPLPLLPVSMRRRQPGVKCGEGAQAVATGILEADGNEHAKAWLVVSHSRSLGSERDAAPSLALDQGSYARAQQRERERPGPNRLSARTEIVGLVPTVVRVHIEREAQQGATDGTDGETLKGVPPPPEARLESRDRSQGDRDGSATIGGQGDGHLIDRRHDAAWLSLDGARSQPHLGAHREKPRPASAGATWSWAEASTGATETAKATTAERSFISTPYFLPLALFSSAPSLDRFLLPSA